MLRDFRQESVWCLDTVRESGGMMRDRGMRADLGNSGHTYPVNVAGWPGSRTYRRAYSATQWFEPHLSAIIGTLYGATFYPPFRCLAR